MDLPMSESPRQDYCSVSQFLRTCTRLSRVGLACIARSHLSQSDSSDPTRPEGTEVKNGALPSRFSPWKCAVGVMKSLASAALANCGMRVSSFVDTTTVRCSFGSISS